MRFSLRCKETPCNIPLAVKHKNKNSALQANGEIEYKAASFNAEQVL